MSCGQNRRRPKLSPLVNSPLRNQTQSSSTKTKSLSHHRKSNNTSNSSKAISHDETIGFSRFRVLDEKGNDVTPRPITNYVRINLRKCYENNPSMTELISKRITENQEQSTSDKSILGTMNLTSSTSKLTGTHTLFSAGDKATLDIGTRIILESEHLLSKTDHDQASYTEKENEESQAKFLPGPGLIQQTDLLTDNVLLSETDTIFILNLDSNIVLQDNYNEYKKIYDRNQMYTDLCDSRQGNDLYIERGMQTFSNSCQNEQITTDPVRTRSERSWVSLWDMYDSNVEANQCHHRSAVSKIVILKSTLVFPLVYRQYENENLNDNQIKLDAFQHENAETRMASVKSSKTSSSQNSSVLFSQDSLVQMTPSKKNCFESSDDSKTKLPAIDVDPFIMERILNMSTYQNEQLIYRDFNSTLRFTRDDPVNLTTNDHLTENNLSSIRSTNINLRRLWHYSNHLTRDRNVSCLCWSEKNHNLLAVGYGTFQYNNEKEGLVCCWSAKNPEFPERYYQTNAGVTALSFSLQRSNLLAVGLFNGNICIFDLNRNNTPPIVDTSNYERKHSKPVWHLAWNERDRSTEINNMEVLVSISSDGRVSQWILRKEFEATDYMHLRPYNSSQASCLAMNHDGRTNTSQHFSNSIGGLCFDIRPDDKTIYLCGTADGFIHRCSTIYNEKCLEYYIGHTGPVYKVHWSPFVENIFLSASADWTVRLWMTGITQSCMVFPSSNAKMFFDAIWSPKSSTMFFCVSENNIEIWDLSKSILDPVYIANCPSHLTLTSITYARNSDCILVGTSDGAVWTYHVDNLSPSAHANDLITIVQQNLFSQLDSSEKNNLPRKVSLLLTEPTINTRSTDGN